MYDPDTEDKIKDLLKKVCQPVTTGYKKEAFKRIMDDLKQGSQQHENPREGLKMENVVVVVNMDSQTLSGTVNLLEGKRLPDYLNGRFPGSGDIATSPFIKLTDVKIYHKDGRKDTADSIYINRQAIQMLRTLSENDARGMGGAETKEFPFVQKMPVKASIYTDVKIHDLRLNSWDDAAFIAVNSTLVFSVKQEE